MKHGGNLLVTVRRVLFSESLQPPMIAVNSGTTEQVKVDFPYN
jgi:hypothetical protein